MSIAERPVASPCVSICALDEQDICTGCQRTAGEITRWGGWTTPSAVRCLAVVTSGPGLPDWCGQWPVRRCPDQHRYRQPAGSYSTLCGYIDR